MRGVQGIAHHRAKLTDNQVLEIRADTRLTKIVAYDFGVADSTINRVRNGKAWTHVGVNLRK